MNDIVLKIPTLSRKYFNFDDLKKKFVSDDKRLIVDSFQKFIEFNRRAFNFLGIKAEVFYEERVNNYLLSVESTKYSGVIPLRSAVNGLITGFLTVVGMYKEEINDIIPLIESDNFKPEFESTLPIKTQNVIPTPKYFDCSKFIDLYERAEKFHWQRFLNRKMTQNRPRNTDWISYSIKSFDPNQVFLFPNNINLLTTSHPEWQSLQYVLDLSISELYSTETPASLKLHYANKLNRLKNHYDKNKLKPIKSVAIHSSDPMIIKDLKVIANRILANTPEDQYAWKIDHSKLFERYVQYTFKLLAQKNGARLLYNPHYNIGGQRPVWALNYIEPDLIYSKNGFDIVVETKYKSHMYNTDTKTEELYTTFREDFHQTLAYSSFNTSQKKKTMLVYPYNKFKVFPIITHNKFNNCTNTTFLVGVPISKFKIPEIVEQLQEIVC